MPHDNKTPEEGEQLHGSSSSGQSTHITEYEALRGRVDALANLAAEHMNCSGCPTPWWLVNWLSDEAQSRGIRPGMRIPKDGDDSVT